MDPWQDVCGLCLTTENVECHLFGFVEGDKTYSDKIREMFQIELKEHPRPFSNACRVCIRVIDEMVELKRKIISSQEKLILLHQTSKDVDNLGQAECFDHTEPSSSSPRSSRSRSLAENEAGPSTIPVDPPEHIVYSDSDDQSEDNEASTDSEYLPDSDPDTDINIFTKRRAMRKDSGPYDDMMTSLGIFKCHKCYRNHKNYQQLARHTRNHHQQCPKLECCNHSFHRSDLEDHMRYHLDNKAFACRECHKIFLCGRFRMRHELSLHQLGDAQITCKDCGKKFAENNQLQGHVKRVHSVPEVHPCTQCDKTYRSTRSLSEHVKQAHDQMLSLICETCGKRFSTNAQLRSHTAHHEAKLTECDICHKFFKYIQQHKRKVHRKKAPIPCPVCGKLISAVYLTIHQRRYHGDKKEFPCLICDKIFYAQKNHKVHMDLHLGVVYACRVCGREFGNAGNRTKHEQAKHPEDYERQAAQRLAEKWKKPAPPEGSSG